MTQEFSFDMREFNRLPKPEVSSLKNASPDDLKRAFPFLFKPNRVLALHPKEEDGEDWGWPLKDPKSRWLVKLALPRQLGYPLCVAVISREGRFSLWSYQEASSSGEKGRSGLFRVPLLNQGQPKSKKPAKSDNSFYLPIEERESGFIEGSPSNFNLLRFVQHCDEEGFLFLRLITPQLEHVIKLDFGERSPGYSVPYHHAIRPYPFSASIPAFRQTGGWNGGIAFFWMECKAELEEGLYMGCVRFGKLIRSPGIYTGLEVIAAAELDGFLAVGGGEGRLWVRSNPQADFVDINQQKYVRGFVRSLELIPSPRLTEKQPLILVGCDDFYLYILNWKGKLLQKAAMGGRVDAVLCLSNQDKWCDVAVLVRNRGLFCARLFYERLRWEKKSKTARELFVDQLWKRLDREGDTLLVKWLHYPDLFDKLHAITAIVNRPSAKTVDLFAPDLHLLFGLNNHITAYLAHILLRKIRHIVEKQQRTETQQQYLRHYLKLLLHMADGPFRTRLAVHGLEGWLLMLTGKLIKEPGATRLLNELHTKLPDAKRVLRILAHKIYLADQAGDAEQAREISGRLLALEERLKFERLFNELVLLPDQETGRVNNVAIMAPGSVYTQQIFCRRGQERLNSFSVQPDVFTLKLVEGEWQHSLHIDDAEQTPAVRILVPVSEGLLAVVTSRRIGIARKTQNHQVDWHSEMPVPLSSAALYAGNENNAFRLLALAGEWRPDGPHEIIYAFEFDGQAKLCQIKDFFSKPKDWVERIRFSALAWDGKGGLWAITGGKGDLFYWPKAAGSRFAQPVNPVHLASTGSPQHALAILEDLTVCGGEDGVLRAFDADGRLLWTNIVPGTIRSITVISPANNPDGQFSDLAVITDAEHVLLFGRDGKHEGILRIPDHFLFSMFSGSMRQTGPQHHFIGTLWGEVRLTEEIPKDWKADQYLSSNQKNGEKKTGTRIEQTEEKNWSAIREAVHKYVKMISDDPELWRIWCVRQDPEEKIYGYAKMVADDPEPWKTLDTPKYPEETAGNKPTRLDWEWTMDEPLRTAWAACRLLMHKDYDTVLEIMWGTRNQPDESTRELRIHVFAGLGSALNEIPKKYHCQVRKLCVLVSDGALASLLLHIPETMEQNMDLLREILYTARQKAHDGRPFVSTAILQRLRRLPDSFSWVLDFFILGTLRKFELLGNTIHPGFIEGLLAVLFQRLNINKGSLLFSFSRLRSRHPSLARALLARSGLRQIFCHWLDRYGGILFSRNNLCVWAALSPELEKEVVDISGALIRLKESPTGGKIEDTRDGIALKGFLGLFPGGRTSANHSELPKGWRKCMKKNQEFRNGIARIAHHLTPVPIGLEWLEHSMRDLEQYAPKLPVVDKFEDAWRHAWLKELGRLRAEVAVEEQVPLLGFEEAAEPVKRFFQAMRDVGFGRGRFYRIIRIPGCDGILKLTYAQGGLQEGHTLPVQHLLTGFLARQIRKYRQTDKPDTKRLISSIHSRSDVDRQDEGISFWDKIIHRNSREVWMEVPVLHQQTEKEYYPIAMFAFDLPGEDELQEAKKQLKFNVPGLRPILNDVVQIVALGARKREQEWHSHLSVLDKRLFSEVDRQAIEKTLLTAAVEISGASDGLLVTHEGAADELTIRAVAGSLQTFLDRVYFSLDEDFYPVVRCWKSRKALYIPNWVQSDLRHSVLKHTDFKGLSPEAPEGFQKWLEEGFGSLVAMPIWSGDKMVGAISLQSASAYSFDLERVRMLESLLQRVRWFLHTAELSDQRRMWERAFVHEIRSDLSPVSKAIEEALLADSDETEWPLTEAKRHCQGLLDLSQNFMDIQANPQADKCLVFTDPGTILSEYLDLYDTLIEQAEQQIEIHPHPDAEIWQYRLLGSREVFARVLRNILDNALKYGEEGAVIRINASLMKGMWLLAMSNPGWMTAEEDALKFRAYEKPNHVRYSGSHVGLAASRIWIHAYGGELKLDNIEEKGDKRVRALLRWPLAEK